MLAGIATEIIVTDSQSFNLWKWFFNRNSKNLTTKLRTHYQKYWIIKHCWVKAPQDFFISSNCIIQRIRKCLRCYTYQYFELLWFILGADKASINLLEVSICKIKNVKFGLLKSLNTIMTCSVLAKSGLPLLMGMK